MRIVSLVPSLTETVVHYGLAHALVGRTRWCTEPADAVAAVETVGGTKNPDVARIVALAPDLVLLNKEENRLEDCRALEAAGIRVHVTHPRTVAEAADMLEELGRACGAPEAGAALAAQCRAALAEAAQWAPAARGGGSTRAAGGVASFCPIWRRPWMTFRAGTYIGDMMAAAGAANVFAGGKPGEGDFFEVTLAEVAAAGPRLVLLPDEPFVFEAKHGEELREAGVGERFVLLDGKDLAWYGPRIPAALQRLSRAVAQVA